MKILKPGKVEQRKFVCPNCGCIFVASEHELYYNFQTGGYETICPNLECGEHITGVRGEPCEEPAPTQTGRGRMNKLICYADEYHTASNFADYLIARGATFKAVSDADDHG